MEKYKQMSFLFERPQDAAASMQSMVFGPVLSRTGVIRGFTAASIFLEPEY